MDTVACISFKSFTVLKLEMVFESAIAFHYVTIVLADYWTSTPQLIAAQKFPRNFQLSFSSKYVSFTIHDYKNIESIFALA